MFSAPRSLAAERVGSCVERFGDSFEARGMTWVYNVHPRRRPESIVDDTRALLTEQYPGVDVLVNVAGAQVHVYGEWMTFQRSRELVLAAREAHTEPEDAICALLDSVVEDLARQRRRQAHFAAMALLAAPFALFARRMSLRTRT